MTARSINPAEVVILAAFSGRKSLFSAKTRAKLLQVFLEIFFVPFDTFTPGGRLNKQGNKIKNFTKLRSLWKSSEKEERHE